MSNPWFFMSYARVDSAGNPHVAEFYSDLVRELRRIAGLNSGTKESDIGFFDASGIMTGAAWPETLSTALRSCRVLITLYSRGYFNSEYCGKEFQVFRSRIDDYVRVSPSQITRPPLILPVLWDRPGRLPKPFPQAVSDIQYRDSEFGGKYAEEGLYFIKKVTKFESEYNEFLLRFAGRIFQEASPDLLPPLPGLPDLDIVINAFHDPVPVRSQSVISTSNIDARVAQFIFVAGRNTDFNGIRENVEGYGEKGGREWRPYYPEAPKPIGIISQHVATMEDLQYETYPLSDDFLERLQEAEQSNSIVVIVVDPWSIQVETYKNHMHDLNMLDLNKTDALNCGVLIPWNESDDETAKSLDELRSNLHCTFTRKFVLNTYFRDSIRSVDELQREISATINEARRRLLIKAKVQRYVEDISNPIPAISGPVGVSHE
jgi:FxsC-like protein